MLSHGVAGSLTWQADADQERFTQAVIKMIENQIEINKLNLKGKVIFPILSTPKQDSYINNEEKDLLKLAIKINISTEVRLIFISRDSNKILSEVKKVDIKIYQDILKHYKKYCWLSYQYQGPAADICYYLERLQALIEQGSSLEKLLDKIILDKDKKLAEQEKILGQLEFNSEQLDIIELSKYLIYLKDYRKAVLFHGMFCSGYILKEIGKRLYLSLEQVRTMSYEEIKNAVMNEDFDLNDLNERIKKCIYYYEKDKYIVYTGKEMKEFLAGIKKEKIKIKETSELSGTIACGGKVRGIVKVINIPQEMNKMKQGNIMVARTTNPNLVPAMAKAAGLISEDGGLTCHTAIVAREMSKPCIVGVKFATKILKDGDQIEVDADDGRVIIIKKNN